MKNLHELAESLAWRRDAIQWAASVIDVLADADRDYLDAVDAYRELGKLLPTVHPELLDAATLLCVWDQHPTLVAAAKKAVAS